MIQPSSPVTVRRLSPVVQAVAALVIVALFAGTALLLHVQSRDAVERARAQARVARMQRDRASELLETLVDAETGQRGFLLTGRADYLDPYQAARDRVADDIAGLTELGRGESWLAGEVATLDGLARRKMDELARSLELYRQQGPEAARDFVLTDVGRATMQQIRENVDRIRTGAMAERDRNVAALDERQRTAEVGVLATGAAGSLLLGLLVVGLLANRASMLRARDEAGLQLARLRGAVDHMRDGVAVFGADGRLLLANEHLASVTGWPPSLLRGDARFEQLAAAAADWPETPLARAELERGQALGTEVHVQGRTLEVWRSPMPDGGQMLTVADRSRRAEAEAVARQAQKMEALGQLTGGVAHDFNNLLQIVSANLEMVGGRIAGDGWLEARLGAAMAGVERAARLTRHLLAFARRQPLAPEAIDTRALLASSEEMLRRTLGETVTLEVVLSGGLWPIRADPQQLENALLNLAINARDAMPGGGRLVIEAGNAALDDSYAAAHADVAPGQYVAIAVTDTGIGMTPEQLARALEPFYTTKTEGHGTGLGLSMVYGFSKQSGGHFKLYSEPGHGTTARLYIPRSRAAPREQTPPPRPVPRSDGELVLIVEDDNSVRAASVQAVRGLGYRVIEATGAGSALALIEGGARPDLLFTDVVMPGQPTTPVMVARARALLPSLGVVYTSGYTENAVVHNGQLDADVILISKPWRTADLARKLRQALAAGQAPVPSAPAATPSRVLLVEDELLVRMTTADMLADLGHEVVEASTAAEALERLQAGADLMLTDIGLPDMDGLELIAEARRRAPALRVIVASGRDVPPGEYVVLDKPYDQTALRKALDRCAAPGVGVAT